MANRRIPLRKYCDADFRGMSADSETGRLCERCDTVVHDLSAMNAEEAEALLAEQDPRLCVRYLAEPNGEIIFKDRPPKIIPTGWLVRGSRAMLIAATALTPLVTEACGPQADTGYGGSGAASTTTDTSIGGSGGTSSTTTTVETGGGSSTTTETGGSTSTSTQTGGGGGGGGSGGSGGSGGPGGSGGSGGT